MLKGCIKRLTALVTALLFIFITGCGSENKAVKSMYDESPSVSKLGDGVINQSNVGILRWDEKNNVILLEGNNKVWSTAPYDYYTSGMPSGRTRVVCTATIAVNYISKPGNAIKTIYSSDVLSRGKISVEKIENGLKVTYYFDTIKVSIPVNYVLEKEYLKISINTDEIIESEQQVYQVAIAPYMASVPNGQKDGYLFVPSGSGALIRTDSENIGTREYQESVYGDDASIGIVSKGLNKASVALPMFGAKHGNSAICGIIESGAESASIVANAGDESLGYSAVYPLFNLRGNNQVQINMIYDGAKQNTTYYSENIHSAVYSVRYYPLTDEDADYTGMAKTYRRYLNENGALKEKIENSSIYLRIIGGMMTDRLFAGIPYKKIKSLTTLEEAEAIISDIENKTGAAPVVQLKGFGESGLDVGKLGGGFKISSALGDFEAYKKIASKYKNTFLDFDLVYFTKSSKSAKTANMETAYGYDYDVISGSKIETRNRFKLLARSELSNAIDDLNRAIKRNSIQEVSLTTLSNVAYSDYEYDKYSVKGALEKDVSKAIGKVKANIMTEAANAYAAACSSHIIESPTVSSQFSVFDDEVPVYQIVFKGYVSMSATEGSTMILDAVESGIGLCYTVVSKYDEDFIELPYSFAAATGVYNDVKTDIFDSYTKVSKCLSLTNKAEINAHSIISRGITKTVFDNGVVVYVNRNDEDFTIDGKIIKANDFVCNQEVRYE